MSSAGRRQGRVCVVTGASGGIGASTVEIFQREGAKVVGVDLLDGAPGDLSISADGLHRAFLATDPATGLERIVFANPPSSVFQLPARRRRIGNVGCHPPIRAKKTFEPAT